MDEKRIWAPWRLAYLVGDETTGTPAEPARWLPQADRQCFLCRAAAEYDDVAPGRRANLVVAAGGQTITLLNRYPYNNGHLLVAPRRHVGRLAELTDEEHLEAMRTLVRHTERLSVLIRAQGFNIGLNLGHVAGAGVPGHLHWHLVPRWAGDANFMSVTADTRVISQSLDALWDAMNDA